jgi:hypothetical protein
MDAFTIDKNSPRSLFVDDLVVAHSQNLHKKLHQPKKHPLNPLVVGDAPWENDFVCLHGMVMWDAEEQRFKMYYMIAPGQFCVAVSEDGVKWKKPALDVFSHEGEPTNIVYRGVDPGAILNRAMSMDCISVMKDPRDPDPARRYKLFTFQYYDSLDPNTFGYYIAFSPDGVHWDPKWEPVIANLTIGDCHSCMYDSLRDRYIAFTKTHIFRPDAVDERGTKEAWPRARSIAFSKDFVNWSEPRLCLCPDGPDARDLNFYCQSACVYEGMYIGIIETYHTVAGTRDCQLVSSRDGEMWWRAGDRQPLIEPGGEGHWDTYMIDIGGSAPMMVGDEVFLYYGGRTYHHSRRPGERPSSAIGLAVFRRDGFVSYDAGAEPGTLVTKPFKLDCVRNLHINVEAAGHIAAEIVMVPDNEGPLHELARAEAVTGYGVADSKHVTGDHLDVLLEWSGGDLSRFAGQNVAIRFHMQDSKLYSFWFE